ncbi:MAG: glycosyltransferase [Thermodesulfobacteriota bacterium]
MTDLKSLRSAIVHHWFLVPSGGERVCEAAAELLERPDFFTLVCRREALTPNLKQGRLFTSFLQKLPRAEKYYRYYVPLYPLAVEQFDLGSYDLVFSSDSSVMKGVITRPETCHVCYCHSPIRYAWNMYHEYRREAGPAWRWFFTLVMHYLRLWDAAAAGRVDYFVANSENVRRRILKTYRREAQVIYPPCDLDRFDISEKVEDFYLVVGRMVAYKRTDIAVRAFSESKRRLVIAGSGPAEKALKAMAGPNVEFLGWTSDQDLASLYSRCRAVVFPAEEDFGLVPVEAQAAGRPVLAFGRGGALESVIAGRTGLFFNQQTPASLNGAVAELEKRLDDFDPAFIRRNAERFNRERFLEEMRAHLAWCLEDHARAFSSKPEKPDRPAATPSRRPG